MELSIEESESKEQTQFENIQHQTIVEEISIREKLESYQNYQADELEQSPQNRLDFLEGNPILPPGKYHLRQQPSFRLKFMSMRQKFNKTSLENAGKSMKTLKKDLSVKQEDRAYKQWQDISQDFEYLTLLQTKKLVYKRINNSKINNIGKERLLCSVFFDWKKQRILSKQQSLLQHLSKNRNLKVQEPQVDWLNFSSNFQSGNLLMAFKSQVSSIPTYQLYMMNDINTKGCTQWYYFSATSKSRGKAKIRLMNFYKPTSLYQKGMKVLISYDGVDWKRTGTSIVYGKSSTEKSQYSLDFIHDFEIPGKQIFFAYGFPYTYSFHLNNYINNITNELKFQKIFHKSIICNSSLGNPIHMLYISNFSVKKQAKPLIYIIGRQHPGETPASYIVQGLVSLLLSNSNQAKELRQFYQFRIVPMVNADGVINGNYRSNVSGLDINRQWQFPSKKGQPEVYWLKNQINSNRKNTVFFLDIHAHSRKMNSFFYGSKIVNKQNKLYPFLCSKLNKFISYNDSAFNDDPSKKTTARVVLQNQLLIPHSLTFEVSFYGWTDSQKQSNYSFKQSDLRNIGQTLGLGFYYTFIGIEKAREVKNSVLPKCQTEKEKILMKNSVKLLQKWNKQLEKESNQQTDDNFSDGSSLNPEHFQLKQEQKFMIAQMMKMKMLQKADDKNTSLKNHSAPKQRQSSLRNKFLIYSSLGTSEMSHQQSKLLAPRQIPSSRNLGISGNQFYHFSSTAKGPKKQPFSVRELELQLQLCGQITPQKKLRGLKLRMGHQNQLISGLDRYESLDMDRQKNYKNDVLQMKKALKYLLQTKSSDYQQYKSCFKSFNNQLLGMQKSSRYYK